MGEGSTVKVGEGTGVEVGVSVGGFSSVAVAVGVGEVHSPGSLVLVGVTADASVPDPVASSVAVADTPGVGEAVGRAVRTSLILSAFVLVMISLAVYGQSGNFNLAG